DTILLGYSHPVPEKLVDVVQEEFGRELNRLSAKVPPALLQQYAWLSANLNVYEDNLQNFNIRGSLAACAWDDNNYYFIAYWPPYSQTRVERLMDAVKESRGELTRRILGFYSIPVTELRQFPSVTEASKLPTENQVRIPE
ncbi:MAG: hypothetical protein KC800_17405, partial [Candidatus Eremiobacteraeota bacterium]|nr:hypothetical protein [Candidatus Eremiobacteraeota bacterium]